MATGPQTTEVISTPILHEGNPERWLPPAPAEPLLSVLDIPPVREAERFLELMARARATSVPRTLPPRARPAIALTGKKGGGRVQKEQVLLPEPSPPVKEIAMILCSGDSANPFLLPLAANTVCGLFTPAEDRLLAMGIDHFGLDWAAVQQHYCCSKTVSQILVRQKNLCCVKRHKGWNEVRAAKTRALAPLSDREAAVVGKVLQRRGWNTYGQARCTRAPTRAPAGRTRLCARPLCASLPTAALALSR